MSDELETDPLAVVVETPTPESDAVAAAEAAVALANTQAAAAELDASLRVQEAAQDIAEVTETVESHSEDMAWLREQMGLIRSTLDDHQSVMENLALKIEAQESKQSIPSASETVEPEAIVEIQEPEAVPQEVARNVADALPVVVTKEPEQNPRRKIVLI